MIKQVFIILGIIVLAAGAACLQETENPIGPVAIGSNALTVDTGYTVGAVDPVWGYMTGEFSAFTMRWTEVQNATYYEVRASEEPITTENWYNATPMTTVQAPADSANVLVRVEVEEETCIGCGLCEEVCPMEAITVQNGVAVIDYELCTACGQCQDVCPVDAIPGTRYGVNYYFGIRAFFQDESAASEISVTNEACRLIYYNNYYTFVPTNSCGKCTDGEESACYIVTDYADNTDQFCGYGCQYDAIWQDRDDIGDIPDMIYIDYDKCVSCGQCLLECWNYNLVINPDPNSYTGLRSIKRKVVSENWVSNYPERP